MKKIITVIFLLFAVSTSAYVFLDIGVYKPYRTNGSYMVADSALFVGKLKIPSALSPSLGGFADKAGQGFLLNLINNRLTVRSGASSWLEYPTYTEVLSMVGGGGVASDLSLGTVTSTTIPVINSNGTGFTIPSATTSLAGLLSATNKTKLDAITGTNTGDQTLTYTSSGSLTISGTGGNSVTISKLGIPSGFEDANTIPTVAGYSAGTNTAAATNYPAAVAGMLWQYFKSPNTAIGAVQYWKVQSSSDAVYYRTGSGVSTFNAWHILADRDWVLGNYAPLARTLTINGVTYDLSANRSWTIAAGGNGTVTSVGMSVPAGFAVTGSPITTSGTFALAFQAGYTLPTTASQSNWSTAFGWGDHASAGYATKAGGNTYTGNQTYTNNIFGSTADFSGNLTSVGFQSTFGNFTSLNPIGLGPQVSTIGVNNITAQRSWEMPDKSGSLAIASDYYSRSEVDSKISGAGGATQSGTYNPTLTTVSNISNYTTYTFTWSRVGDIVTVYGSINISPTSTGTLEFSISLPYGTIATQYDLNGTGNTKYEMGDVDAMSGDATNNRARVQLTVRNASFGRPVYLTYQYKHTSM